MIRIGVLTPHAAVGPEAELPAMAPKHVNAHVARVSFDAGACVEAIAPTTPAALRSSTTPPYLNEALARLIERPTDAIGYASTTAAYVVGFDAEMAMVSRLAALAEIPVVATCASAVSALRVLAVERVALIGAPWFEPEFNQLGAAYFRSQGFDVLSSASADLSQDASQIEPAAVQDWTLRHVRDDAEAVFIGGNGFRAVGAIEGLEVALGRPVLTSNQVLLWSILSHVATTVRVDGFGRLFATIEGKQTS